MSQTALNVQSRQGIGKEAAKKLRVAGRVPAVIYGHKEAPQTLSINARELRDLLAHAGAHGLLMLQEDGSSTPAVIKTLQRHPVSHVVASVDFLRVSLDETITTSVPLVFVGETDEVKSGEGVLVHSLQELQISAFPQNVPESIVVNVSNLVFNGAPIHVRELTLPQGVTAITDGDEPVAVVNRAELEEAAEPTTPLGEEDTAAAAQAVPTTEEE